MASISLAGGENPALGSNDRGITISWLTDALAPAVVALVQLAVVTAALHVARLAKARAAAAEAELEALRADKP